MIFSGGSGWIAPQTARSWVGDLFLKRCVFFWDRGEVPECHSVGPWVGDLRGGGDYPTCPPWSCTERFSNPPPFPGAALRWWETLPTATARGSRPAAGVVRARAAWLRRPPRPPQPPRPPRPRRTLAPTWPCRGSPAMPMPRRRPARLSPSRAQQWKVGPPTGPLSKGPTYCSG